MISSRFFVNNFVNSKKKRPITKYNLGIINLVILIIILIFSYSILIKKDNFFSTKFESFNKILINNGFKIQNVEINGLNHLNKEDILEIIRSYNHINIFSVNLKKVYKEIKRNTWVKQGSIKIIYPNTIKIWLTEKKPIAIWQKKSGDYYLVTKIGEIILEKNLSNFKNKLPIIIGKNANKNVYSILKLLNSNKKLAKNIWSLTYINERRWDLHFKQGVTIRLPSKNVEKAWLKILYLNRTFDILNLDLTEVDLRNPKQILGKINIDKKLIFKKKNS